MCFLRQYQVLTLILCMAAFFHAHLLQSQVLLNEDFENGLSAWEINTKTGIRIVDSNSPKHQKVLELAPNGNIHALVKDSDKWGAVRVEGEMLFPNEEHSYLGFIYNYQKRQEREDFGVLYIKGNGSYIRANPWRDGNVSRLMYEEYKTKLKDDQAIVIGEWQKFKMEVLNEVCHLYVIDMETPKVTFDLFEWQSGKVGFQPRVVGGAVWIDNIEVSSIAELSYQGDAIPPIEYQPDSLITAWEVIGPLSKPNILIENSDEKTEKVVDSEADLQWVPFETDKRGAVITGRITEYEGVNTVAYFRTWLVADVPKTVVLHFTTTDELTLFLNGEDYGRVYRDGYVSRDNDWNAWYDFWQNDEHAGRRIELDLKKGKNQLVIKVRNGQFASGGFFVKLE